MWKSLRYFWRMNLTLIGAVAVTTAVLTGALLVGDSVRASLRNLTLNRLGKINYALLSERFFHQRLGMESSGGHAAPAILLQGSATLNKKRASNIQINGIDSGFLSFFGSAHLEEKLNLTEGTFPPVVINQSLARELSAKEGDEVLLAFTKPAEIHRETILGNRDVTEVVQRNRFTITAIIPNQDVGRFSLSPNQHLPFNAFVPLNRMQRLLRQQGEVNALLFSSFNRPNLKPYLKLQDLGLRLIEYSGMLSLESDEVVLKPQIVKAATEAADSLHLNSFRVLTHLANTISYQGKIVPYSTVTAINPPQPFVSRSGARVAPLQENEILLNEWAANELQVAPGELVDMTYYVLGDSNRLLTRSHSFRVKEIIQQTGLAADPNLAPRYPGIEDAHHISDWSPPFPVDLNLIRPQDETYWDTFRATPKAFISDKTAEKLWTTRFGTYTSIRFQGRTKNAVGRELMERLNPEELNLQIRDVKMEGMRAAEGATDFGSLFIGFSMFLIGSAVLLVGLLFRLNIDQRKKEVGILLATGLRTQQIRNRLLFEGLLLGCLGGLAGVALASGYAWLMITALQSWWIAAIGTSFLSLHIAWKSLLIGFGASVVICFLTIALSVRLLSRWPVVALIKGSEAAAPEHSTGKWSGKIALSMLLLAAGFSFFAFQSDSAALFFTGGASLLIACLAFFAYWLRSLRKFQLRPGRQWITILKIAMRNAVRNPGRSLLSATLVGSACFVIVAVGANRRPTEMKWQEKDSGTGGFGIVGTSSVPIYEDLTNPTVLQAMELNTAGKIYPFRLLPGDDASCLNLYQPEKPRVLGVPREFMNRGGFAFQETIREAENPWTLLKGGNGNIIPAIGDYNSVRWILHKKLGEDITLINDDGKPVRLRLVALLNSSLLQSELLISEENFVKHFPTRGGSSYFLIEADAAERMQVLEKLESGLDVYGFDAVFTEEKLAAYHAVENTYLSTFQTLGALGLLLGTLGLGIILIRNVIERRRELATMRALGFGRRKLGWFVLIENGFLLTVGIGAGCIAAMISILPHLLKQSPDVPWASLVYTLLLVFAVGMTASVAAILSTLRIPLLPALKSE